MYLAQAAPALEVLRFGGDGNRIDTSVSGEFLARLFAAVTEHARLTHLDFKCSQSALNGEACGQLALCLRTNCVLRELPIEALVYATEPRSRFMLLHASR